MHWLIYHQNTLIALNPSPGIMRTGVGWEQNKCALTGPTYVGKSLNKGWILCKGFGGDTNSIKDERTDGQTNDPPYF